MLYIFWGLLNIFSDDSVKINPTASASINLEKTLIAEYRLLVLFGQEKDGKINIPMSASSSTNGFISGTNWKPLSISIDKTDDNNQFEYFVRGVVEWQLMGATVYSQPKKYKGFLSVK